MQWASRNDNFNPDHFNYNPTNDFDHRDPSNDTTNYFYPKPNHHHYYHHYDYHQPYNHNHRCPVDDYGSTKPQTRPGARHGNLEFHGFLE